jgi:hypothetical protein
VDPCIFSTAIWKWLANNIDIFSFIYCLTCASMKWAHKFMTIIPTLRCRCSFAIRSCSYYMLIAQRLARLCQGLHRL